MSEAQYESMVMSGFGTPNVGGSGSYGHGRRTAQDVLKQKERKAFEKQDIEANGNVTLPESWSDYQKDLDNKLEEAFSSLYKPEGVGSDSGDLYHPERFTGERSNSHVTPETYKESQLEAYQAELEARRKGAKPSPGYQGVSAQMLQDGIDVILNGRGDIYREQVNFSAQNSLGYLNSEIKRLEDTPFDSATEKSQVLGYLRNKRNQISSSYDVFDKDPSKEAFSIFYGDKLPDVVKQVEVEPDKPLGPTDQEQLDTRKAILIEQLVYGTSRNGKPNSRSVFLKNNEILDLVKLKEKVNNAKSLEDLEDIYIPVWKGDGNSKHKIYDLMKALEVESTITIHKNGGKLPAKRTPIQKAQFGKVDWSQIDKYIKSTSFSNPDDRFGQTANYADAKDIETLQPDNGMAPPSTPKTPGDVLDTEGDMQVGDGRHKRLYRQEGNIEKSRRPMLSRTGVNTPIGEIQYNDIAQFALALRARNKKLDEVPVNLEEHRDVGGRDVLAARDIDAGMLNSANQEIGKIRSKYNGSDPIMAMVSRNMASESKNNAHLQLISKRADYRRGEEDRVVEQMEQRRVQLADNDRRRTAVENRNNEKLYQSDLATAQDKARRDSEFTNNLGTLFADIQGRWNIDSTQQKQLTTALVAREHQGKTSSAQARYAAARDKMSNLEYGIYGEPTREMYQSLQAEMDAASREMQQLNNPTVEGELAQADKINRGQKLWRR